MSLSPIALDANPGPDAANVRREITHSCTYRVLWCPKYRRPLLEGMEAEVEAELRFGVAEMKGEVLLIRVTSDLVSLQLRVDPLVGLHKTVRHLKASTWRTLRQRHPALVKRIPTLWNSRYLVATIGGEPAVDEVLAFMDEQRNA
jgi:putative transposase